MDVDNSKKVNCFGLGSLKKIVTSTKNFVVSQNKDQNSLLVHHICTHKHGGRHSIKIFFFSNLLMDIQKTRTRILFKALNLHFHVHFFQIISSFLFTCGITRHWEKVRMYHSKK